ncbi:hypothetical protein DFH06DRAFT_1463723 [Mycena polygramma]|nr:hypothetical protein DFH06DRAFT_1463723 [Mycena polygramma]
MGSSESPPTQHTMSPARTLDLDSKQGLGTVNETAATLTNLREARATGRVFIPRMDIDYDHEAQNVVATLELPGIKLDQLSISFKQGLLEVRGQRLYRHRPGRRHHSRRTLPQVNGTDTPTPVAELSNVRRFFPYHELCYGNYYRRVRLPYGVDISCISASLSDGWLTICWPRSLSEKQPSDSRGAIVDLNVDHPVSSVRSDPQDVAEESKC